MHENLIRRNRNFYESCIQEIEAVPAGTPIRGAAIAGRAALRAPDAYYLEYDYALRQLRSHRQKPGRYGSRTRHSYMQWEELSQRVAMRQHRRGLTDAIALQQELQEGRPSSYFLSPAYAYRLFKSLSINHTSLKP